MSKQANTKLIGGFVVGAVVLAVAGILLFGSGKLLTKQKKFVLFFEDSVSGLTVGSPVDFKGVRVGAVTEVNVVLEKDDLSLRIPVFVEIQPERIKVDASKGELAKMATAMGGKSFLDVLVDRGLRAQLEMQSLVTGQLAIHLDFFPDKPVRLVGAEPGYLEIPTIKSSLSEIAQSLQELPLAEIAQRVLRTLDGAEKIINSPEIKEIISAFNQTAKAAHVLVVNLDGQIKPLASNADLTLSEARNAFTVAGQFMRNLDAGVPKLVASLEDTSKAAGAAVRGANKAVDGLAGDNSPVRTELIKTLAELSTAARSFRVLTQYLENHPEALLHGKGK